MPKRLFADVPEDLAALGDESLADLLTSFRETSGKLKNAEIDLAEHFGDEIESDDDRSAEAMRQWQEAAETVREIRAVQTARADAEAKFAETAETLHAEFDSEPVVDEVDLADVETEALADAKAKADEEEEEEDEDAKPEATASVDEVETAEVEKVVDAEAAEVVEEAEAIVAAAAPQAVRFPAVRARNQVPVDLAPDDGGRVVLLAAGGNGNSRIVEGQRFDRLSYADSLTRVVKTRGKPVKHKDGSREQILVASAKFDYPDEAKLFHGDDEGNADKLAKVGNYFLSAESRQTLMAAGGICAPPTPFYNLPNFGTTARPIRDFLPSFQTERGGVLIPGVTTIADGILDGDSFTIITAEDDAEGGTFSTKSCADMDCAEWTATYIAAIAHCRTYGVFNARTWQEGIAHENDLTMVGLARTAEGRLLDRLDALSLDATGVVTYGASSSLLYSLTLARVGMISRFRMDPDTRVQAILPFWAADMFAQDLVQGAVEGESRFARNRQAVSALLSQFGIDVGWHLDQGLDPAATDEIWPVEVDGSTLNDWVGSTVIARVFLPGTFLHLDGGELELGLIRDSTLIETNDYEMFGEIFENVARVGPAQAALRVALSVCPDGTIAGRDTSPFSCAAS
jgi:hypothetical protein